MRPRDTGRAVKEILSKDRENVERLKPAYEEMVQSLSKVGTAMYEAAASSSDGMNGAGGAEADETVPEDEATVEGEFREVGSDR